MTPNGGPTLVPPRAKRRAPITSFFSFTLAGIDPAIRSSGRKFGKIWTGLTPSYGKNADSSLTLPLPSPPLHRRPWGEGEEERSGHENLNCCCSIIVQWATTESLNNQKFKREKKQPNTTNFGPQKCEEGPWNVSPWSRFHQNKSPGINFSTPILRNLWHRQVINSAFVFLPLQRRCFCFAILALFSLKNILPYKNNKNKKKKLIIKQFGPRPGPFTAWYQTYFDPWGQQTTKHTKKKKHLGDKNQTQNYWCVFFVAEPLPCGADMSRRRPHKILGPKWYHLLLLLHRMCNGHKVASDTCAPLSYFYKANPTHGTKQWPSLMTVIDFGGCPSRCLSSHPPGSVSLSLSVSSISL